MENFEKPKRFDLEDRTLQFAKEVRIWVKSLKMNLINLDDCKQVIRSSGSVGANYIEANESLGKKDFLMRIKICRKEAKECKYWFNLIETEPNSNQDKERLKLIEEASSLIKIFHSIFKKSE